MPERQKLIALTAAVDKAVDAHATATPRRDLLTIKIDFAAALEATQKDTECAQQASKHHLLVMCASWNNRRLDIPDDVRQRRRRGNEEATRMWSQNNIYAYVYSEHAQKVCVHAVCMYVCMHACMYACMYVLCLYMYACMYVCMYG